MTDSTTNLPVTRQLARFASALEWTDVPTRIQDLMPILLIDSFRVGAIGSEKPWTRAVANLYASTTSSIQANLFFSPDRIDAVRAAFVNGVACGSMEWDDSHVAAIVHPGIVVWPSLLATAQSAGATGQEVLQAAVVGYEVAIRIGMSVQPELSIRGFQGTMTCGTLGAAAACAKLLKFDVEQTCDALGIASSFASGIAQFFISGSDVKRLHAGKAAANGMEAALLARIGLSGPHDAIEGKQGFARAFSDRFDPKTVVGGLGTEFPTQIMSLKPHAGSVRVQASIEAAAGLAAEGITPDAIEAVEIGVSRAMMGKLTSQEPRDQQAAQLSAPIAIAMALILATRRPLPVILAPDDFERAVDDQEIRALALRTTCYVDSEVEQKATSGTMPGRVRIQLKDGSTQEKFVLHAKGGPENPLTLSEACDRFRVAAARFDSAEVDRWLDVAINLASQSDVSGLFSLGSAKS